jgi:hypothetical protein
MITNQKIIDELNHLLVENYPDYTVYINKVLDGFERPSFFIEYVMDDSGEENKNITEEKLLLQLIYFGNEDEYGEVDSIEQQLVLNKLKGLFKLGFIKVEDRAIRIKASGKLVDGEIGLSLTFSYYEQKTEEDPSTQHELMGEIKFKHRR